MNIQNTTAFGRKINPLRQFIQTNPGAKITYVREGDSFSATLLKGDKGPYTMLTSDIYPAKTKNGALKVLVKLFNQTIGKVK